MTAVPAPTVCKQRWATGRAGNKIVIRLSLTLFAFDVGERRVHPFFRISAHFNILDGFRTEEIGDFLNRRGIAVRAGHHCARPIHRRFGIESNLRASLALYNNFEDLDGLIAALWDLKQGRNPGVSP